jgi:hypothetical protein
MPIDVRTLEPLLVELNERIDKLRVTYEQYYLGMELLPPETTRQAIARAFAQMSGTHIANTALKFKYQALTQKWGSYTQYWNRVAREIEAGTYIRHVQRLKRKQAAETGAQAGARDAREVEKLVDAIGLATTGGPEGAPAGAPHPRDGQPSDEEFAEYTVTDHGSSDWSNLQLPQAGDEVDDWLDQSFAAITNTIRSGPHPPLPDRLRPGRVPELTPPKVHRQPSPSPSAPPAQPAAPRAPAAKPAAPPATSARPAPPATSARPAAPAPPAPSAPPRVATPSAPPKAPPTTTPPAPPTTARPAGPPAVPPPLPASARPAAPPAGPSAAPARPALPAPEIDRLYKSWVDAKKNLGQPTAGLAREALADTINKQLPDLLAKHRNGVKFEVVVKDGKAILKAVPKP